MTQDEIRIKNRLLELANMCYQRDIPTHSDFLDLNSQSIFQTILRELPPVSYELMGGYSLSERKCILFVPYDGFEADSPIELLKFRCMSNKSYEQLTHRDYLGAIMSLGIKREQIGDLAVEKDGAYLFCLKSMSKYIMDQLTSVKHTPISISKVDLSEFIFEPKVEHMEGSVASVRLDAILALGFNISRNHIISYIEEGKVFVNSKCITTNAYNLHADDLISVRGLGKIRFCEVSGTTRKGRMIAKIDKFV